MRDELERGKVLRLSVKVIKGKYVITLWDVDSWVKGEPSIADQTGNTAQEAVRKILPYITRQIDAARAALEELMPTSSDHLIWWMKISAWKSPAKKAGIEKARVMPSQN